MQLGARRANDALIGLFSLVRIPIFSRCLDVKSGSGAPVNYHINHVAVRIAKDDAAGVTSHVPSVSDVGCDLCPSAAFGLWVL